MQRIYYDDEKRFWSKVEKTDTCWIWTGTRVSGRNGNRYGVFAVMERESPLMAHRWIYERLVGPIPSGLQLDHLCRNGLCVRPDHLEPVTQAENLRRENIARGRLKGCYRCGCDSKHRCYGMCEKHFQQWKKAGKPALT